MKVNGIIAEYNPFHNGHKYQLEESLRLTGADYTVVVMSGNFVQRGAPALADKHLRTEMALRCGADLVLELPVLYAASSAEFFAAGAVSLLDRLGVVTHLCFGSEWGDIELLENVAEFLLEEPEEYRTALKDALKKGLSYPKARGEALVMLSGTRAMRTDNKIALDKESSLDEEITMNKEIPLDEAPNEAMTNPAQTGNEQENMLSALLSLPNNILGIEYIRALRKRHSSIQPFTIKRAGAGYHDSELNSSRESGAVVNTSCSAFAIRQALQEEISPLYLTRYMPQEAGNLFLTWLEKKKPVCADDFSSILYYKLLTEKLRGYERYLDVSSDLSERIKNKLGEFTGFEAFCDLLKTKNITHTRISRCLIHILLGIEKEDMTLGKTLDHAPYARILGFRKSAVPLLGAIKAHASIPLISKLADAEKILPPDAAQLLAKDIMAGDIYRGVLYAGTGCAASSEYTTPLVIL